MSLDKDLVLPPMTASAAEQSFLVVASTDMDRVPIMMTRIREQLEKVADFKTIGELTLSAEPVSLPDPADLVEKKVQEVAARVTEMARLALGPAQNST